MLLTEQQSPLLCMQLPALVGKILRPADDYGNAVHDHSQHSREDVGAIQHWQLYVLPAILLQNEVGNAMLCGSLVRGSDFPEPCSLPHYMLVQLLT